MPRRWKCVGARGCHHVACPQIAHANFDQAGTIILLLITSLADADGVVREAAVEALGLAAAQSGRDRENIITALLNAAADHNPLVAKKAVQVLENDYMVPKERLMRNLDAVRKEKS